MVKASTGGGAWVDAKEGLAGMGGGGGARDGVVPG
jgi:hypothetical protein